MRPRSSVPKGSRALPCIAGYIHICIYNTHIVANQLTLCGMQMSNTRPPRCASLLWVSERLISLSSPPPSAKHPHISGSMSTMCPRLFLAAFWLLSPDSGLPPYVRKCFCIPTEGESAENRRSFFLFFRILLSRIYTYTYINIYLFLSAPICLSLPPLFCRPSLSTLSRRDLLCITRLKKKCVEEKCVSAS